MEKQLVDPRIRRFIPVRTIPTIACCNCGKPMESNGLAMCSDCIGLAVDITEGIQKEATLIFCKNCERLSVPPYNWIYAPRESKELLGACLKRLKGLSKVRLIDAKFIWTEPHSRRTVIKVTVQGEAEKFQNTVIQQDFKVTFVETTSQCRDCAKSFTANTWRAIIQIRQKVDHKKTFFYLEQLILKNNAHRNTVSIQESREGLDFFYSQRNHALKMLDFLTSVVPARSYKSEEAISQDTHTGAKSYKFSYSVEIVPICKEDLVVLPKKLARAQGNINPLVLCHRIGNTVHFIDPSTLQTTEVTSNTYWREPFPALSTTQNLTEYMVLDIEPVGPVNGKFALADVTVARTADMGRNDATYYVRTHLGGILHPGDAAMGYHLANNNFNSDLWDELNPEVIPDVVLVKKAYPNKTKSKTRSWKLRRMAKESNDLEEQRARGIKGNDAMERSQRDYEEFLRELEEDPEFRSEINLYKLDEAAKEEEERKAEESEKREGDDDDDDDEEDYPEIKLNELRTDEGEDWEDEEEEEE